MKFPQTCTNTISVLSKSVLVKANRAEIAIPDPKIYSLLSIT